MTYADHRARANLLLKGWEQKPVTGATWDEAEHHITEMYVQASTPEEEDRAVQAYDKLGAMHSLWASRQQPMLLEV